MLDATRKAFAQCTPSAEDLAQVQKGERVERGKEQRKALKRSQPKGVEHQPPGRLHGSQSKKQRAEVSASSQDRAEGKRHGNKTKPAKRRRGKKGR